MTRLALIALAAVLVATGCGRKDDPERPPGAERRDPATTIRLGPDAQDDDPLLEPLPQSVANGPRVEEQVDHQLD